MVGPEATLSAGTGQRLGRDWEPRGSRAQGTEKWPCPFIQVGGWEGRLGRALRKDSASCDGPHGVLRSSVHPASPRVEGTPSWASEGEQTEGPHGVSPHDACAGLYTSVFHGSLSIGGGVQGQPRHLSPPCGDQGCGHLVFRSASHPGACRLPLQAAPQTQTPSSFPQLLPHVDFIARCRWRHWEGRGGGGPHSPGEVTEAASAWPPRWSPDLWLSSPF